MARTSKLPLAAAAPTLSRFQRGDSTSPTLASNSPEPNPWEPRYAPQAEVEAIVGVSGMTLRRWSANPEVGFPAPVKLGPSEKAWNYWWLPEIGAFKRQMEERNRIRRERNARKPKRRIAQAKRLKPTEAEG
jgi:predicted DNA-binding transcriptional regulator AlpA